MKSKKVCSVNKEAYEALTGQRLLEARDNWRTLCPAHSESTPSFYIHKETNLCHCFGCGVRGYIDTVLAQVLETPSHKLRDVLDISASDRLHLPIDPPEQQFTKAWLGGFKRISMHPYLKARGFKSETVLLHSARWDPEGRIVFPLKSIQSPDIVGAAGRAVKEMDKKWYFYWNTKPGKILYQPIDTLQLSIIVEGIFDVMWLNQNSYQGVAALLRSSATKRQVELIKQNTDEVLLFLDNDEAGKIGAQKLANELRTSVKVTYASYPEGKKDPQELTKQELDTVIESRQTYVEFSQNK